MKKMYLSGVALCVLDSFRRRPSPSSRLSVLDLILIHCYDLQKFAISAFLIKKVGWSVMDVNGFPVEKVGSCVVITLNRGENRLNDNFISSMQRALDIAER